MSAYEQAGRRGLAAPTVRRAWIVIAAASILFLLFAGAVAAAIRYYYVHATEAEHAYVEVVSGSGALWRDSQADDWTLIDGRVEIGEGDEVSTVLGTTAWITFFDGSTAEISEDSVVRFTRMRSSRHVERTREIVLEPDRGLISVAMASRGDAEYVEILVRTEHADIVMSDEPGRPDGGAFLVEIVPIGVEGDRVTHSIRAAARRGAISVQAAEGRVRVEAGHQVEIAAGGEIGDQTGIIRSLILNGSFNDGLAGWEPFHAAQARETPGSEGTVVLSEGPDGAPAITIDRPEGARVAARTGVRQEVKKSIQPSGRLELSFDVMIEHQGPPAASEATVPLIIEIEYLDTQGEDQQWSTGYVLEPEPDLESPSTTTSNVLANDWTHVIFELGNLAPSARHIESFIVYASGTSYRSSITNLVLTSSEVSQTSP